MAAARAGHVNRDRLLAEGSVLARIAQEKRQSQQHAAVDAADATPPQQDAEQDAAELSWAELYDARTTAAYAGATMGQQELSDRSLQLWWTSGGSGTLETRHRRRPQYRHSRLLHHSAVLARTMQRAQHASQQQGAPAASLWQPPAAPAPVPVKLSLADPCELFGPAAKRQRRLYPSQPQQQQQQQQRPLLAACDSRDFPTAWVCCNVVMELDSSNQHQAVRCGASNEGSSTTCSQCGAAAWSGPDGQADARIAAVLQTADLDVTNLRQVMARVVAESGSHAGLGLVPPVRLQADVLAVVHARKSREACGSAQGAGGCSGTYPAATHGPHAAAAQQAESGSGLQHSTPHARASAGGVNVADSPSNELKLLNQYACVPQAHGVFTCVLSWLDQQQQQQQQQTRLSAAAAAAAMAPNLLAGVLQQQAGLPRVHLKSRAVLAWVADLFAEAAAGAAGARSPAPPRQQFHSCPALRRPLPVHTVLALCDRPGAVLRQQLVDAAALCVSACQGALPSIKRSYELDGHELMSEQVPPSEWLWARWGADLQCKRVLRAHGKAVQRERPKKPEGGAAGSESDEEDSDGNLTVLECITSSSWSEVVFVRIRVRALLSAWHCRLQQQMAPLEHAPTHDHQLYLTNARALHRGLSKLLDKQVQHITNNWGSAPPWLLRRCLAAWHPDQPPAAGLPAGRAVGRGGGHPSSPRAQPGPGTGQGEPEAHKPSKAGAAAGVRRSARLHALSAVQRVTGTEKSASDGSQRSKSPAGSTSRSHQSSSETSSSSQSDSETSSSSQSTNSTHSFSQPNSSKRSSSQSDCSTSSSSKCHKSSSPDSPSSGADSASGDGGVMSCGERAQHRHVTAADKLEHLDDELTRAQMLLDGVEDLLQPLLLAGLRSHTGRAGSSTAGQGDACMPGKWRPNRGSLWQPVTCESVQGTHAAQARTVSNGGGAAALCRPHLSHSETELGVVAVCEQQCWSALPEGMRVVLTQAASRGVGPEVLRRAAARLARLVDTSM